ncbi:shikimate dehydrogenase family protein [Maribacter sp. 2-571]|uniref:shikimate dehydrogenase family protein n=1 Tax=Maribacter sp. 2-571 TaxID=3417569 RepID=UPI003D33A9B4
MEKKEAARHRYGLIGKNIGYSFSRGHFTKKFQELGLDGHSYENFDLPDISDFERLKHDLGDIQGFNVTIPYKEAIFPYLTEIDEKALQIGAVNTIKVAGTTLLGYNTDAYGFQKALEPKLKKHHQKALILGTGGASKAVAYVLDHLGISFSFVSRNPKPGQFGYGQLNSDVIKEHLVLINATPLGTQPNVTEKPPLPYDDITEDHLLFDLIYNPEKTAFLQEGEQRGATISNGLRMLELQAEKAWEIWTERFDENR